VSAYQLAALGAFGNFAMAAATQSLVNAAVGVVIVAVLLLVKP